MRRESTKVKTNRAPPAPCAQVGHPSSVPGGKVSGEPLEVMPVGCDAVQRGRLVEDHRLRRHSKLPPRSPGARLERRLGLNHGYDGAKGELNAHPVLACPRRASLREKVLRDRSCGRAREIAEVQAKHPEHIIRCQPEANCIMIYEPGTSPETIDRDMWGPPPAEIEFERELRQRKSDLLRRSKMEQVGMVRTPGAWFSTDPALWTKGELADHLVLGEDNDERYEAYGRVALHNGKPSSGTRPLCGGSGCYGHDNATPWPETRERFRAKAPCIDAPTSQTPPSEVPA